MKCAIFNLFLAVPAQFYSVRLVWMTIYIVVCAIAI